MALTLELLATIVAEAKFDALKGEVEGQFLDVKGQPYKFANPEAKREFAKDVAAFANAQGGYILVGFATTTSNTMAGEEIDEVRPIPESLFDIQQHIKLLQDWLYPQPLGVDIKWVSFGQGAAKGILVVFVPPQNDRSKPFLVTKTVTDRKTTDILIGYAERKLDFTESRSVEEIHHAIRLGLNIERELLGLIESLEALITQHYAGVQQSEDKAQASSRLQKRIAKFLDEA